MTIESELNMIIESQVHCSLLYAHIIKLFRFLQLFIAVFLLLVLYIMSLVQQCLLDIVQFLCKMKNSSTNCINSIRMTDAKKMQLCSIVISSIVLESVLHLLPFLLGCLFSVDENRFESSFHIFIRIVLLNNEHFSDVRLSVLKAKLCQQKPCHIHYMSALKIALILLPDCVC